MMCVQFLTLIQQEFNMANSIFHDLLKNSNFQSLKELTDSIFAHRSRVLVIRVDFNYLHQYKDAITCDLAIEHRNRLLDNRRRNRTLFAHLLGYAWAFEHGNYAYDGMKGTGFHHHFVFFFDGAERQEDISIGLGILNYWRSVITHGMGHGYVSNFDKEKFENMGQLGIGMIHRDDQLKRNNLLAYALSYLIGDNSAVTSLSIEYKSEQHRSFGRSHLLKAIDTNAPRRGRPPLNDINASKFERIL